MYLMRVIPPRQLCEFMENFDALLQKGFEKLLGIKIEEKWWRLTQLPPKYGGLALRSGLRTYGAQHVCSLAKSSTNVGRIVGGWDVVEIAKRDTERWLNDALEDKIDIAKFVYEIQARSNLPVKHSGRDHRIGNYRYSLAQLCELSEQKRLMSSMSSKERVHIEAHSGQHHLWVTQLPLSFKRYSLTSPEWVAAARRRLMVDVFPLQRHCTFCKGGWCDVKGEHAIICGGGHTRTLRHDTIRNIVAKAARDAGCSTDLEHG